MWNKFIDWYTYKFIWYINFIIVIVSLILKLSTTMSDSE